jgi:hypothetical protein
VWQAIALRAGPQAFEQKLPIRTESAPESTVDGMNICLVQLSEALPPDAVPELSDVKTATHLDDTKSLTVRAAEPVTSYHEPPCVTRFTAW